MTNVTRFLFCLILALTTFGSSYANTPNDSAKSIVSFSGGGYHALTGAASWMMGMMARTGKYDMSHMEAVDAIGSNSGGSWFMSLSTFSPSFIKQLQSPDAAENFTDANKNGYMGLVWKYLSQKKSGCEGWPQDYMAYCTQLLSLTRNNGFVNFLVSGQGQWQDVVNTSVYGLDASGNTSMKSDWPYWDEIKDITLNQKDMRNAWMQDKDWVIAGTFLTEMPAVTYTSKEHIINPNKLNYASAQTYRSSYDKSPVYADIVSEGAVYGGVPIAISSDASTNLFPGGEMNLQYGYWDNKFNAISPNTASTQEWSKASKSIPVTHAAGISSAEGGGFVDIKVMKNARKPVTTALNAGKLTTMLNGFAPAYQMYDNAKSTVAMSFLGDVHSSLDISRQDASINAISKILADNVVVRFADGGFVDNTAVAQMLRYLQDKNNGKVPADFNIIAFDDFPKDRESWVISNGNNSEFTPFPTGPDVAALFGYDGCNDQSCNQISPDTGLHTSSLLSLEYTGPAAQIFGCGDYFTNGDKDPLHCTGGKPDTSKLFWWPEKKQAIHCGDLGAEQSLLYARYTDVVVDDSLPGSKLYGLNNPDRSSGTLHVFSILGKGAAVVPGSEKSFDCYKKVIAGMVENITDRAPENKCNLASRIKRPTLLDRKNLNLCTLGDYLQHALGQ